IPALPFSLPDPGQYQIVFYSIDSFNNREVNNTNLVVVSGSDALDFSSVGTAAQPIFASGDALSIRPSSAPISFQALPDPSPIDARAEVFQGVVGWATV